MTFPLGALLLGLWSAGHCLAMCGGLAMAAGQSQQSVLRAGVTTRALRLATWQVGRIISYAVMGFLAGGFGGLFLDNAPVSAIRDAAFIAANLILIGLGLHVANIWSGIQQMERAGQLIWRFLAPMAQSTLLPKAHARHSQVRMLLEAFRAGTLWGWLPCGLVYSMLVTASVTGSATSGALWMLAFGLGTVPALWLASMASAAASQFLRHTTVRLIAGGLIATFGIWGLLRLTGLLHLEWLDAFCIGSSSFKTP